MRPSGGRIFQGDGRIHTKPKGRNFLTCLKKSEKAKEVGVNYGRRFGDESEK